MTQSGQPGESPPPPPASPPPPPSDWQSTPQQPSSTPSSGSGGTPSWTGNITSTAPVAGPAGYYYADVPNRIIAFIVDYILFFIVFFIVGAVTLGIFGTNLGFVTTTSVLVQNVLSYLLVGAYFVYTWTTMRGTLGMKLLGMQIGQQGDGQTITFNQGILRYAVMFGPGFVAGLLSAFVLSLGLIASLIAFIWFIALLVTTAQSPTKQGLHDKYAQTMVVKAARSAG
jgi:uncharacterized RDD family membrane protein YckC